MIMKRIFILCLALLVTATASAQSDLQCQQEIRAAADLVRTKYQTTQSMLDIYQMAGNAQGYQTCQYEMQYHHQYFSYLEQLAQNPGQLRNPSVYQDYQSKYWEYCYRTGNQDYRPYQQIAPALQQWVAQRNWEASTPEGRQAYQNRQVQNQANFEANQAQHRESVNTFDNYMTGLRNDSNQRDKYQHQYVNTIHDRYEYVNPYDGQSYMYQNTYNNNPTMQNPDGSYTELVPYQNY
jgi:hypothetical protein